MTFTKEQAITEHRKMWNWIADETEKRKRKIRKSEYFKEHHIAHLTRPWGDCYCCEYALIACEQDVKCMYCPIDWGSVESCFDGVFASWLNEDRDYKIAAELARKIANLPENKIK